MDPNRYLALAYDTQFFSSTIIPLIPLNTKKILKRKK
jgi:hypothetical protein